VRIFIFSVIAIFAFTKPVFAATGVAQIAGTAEGSTVTGKAVLTEENSGLKVDVRVEGVPPGNHGFHIHEKGECGDSGKAAGGHYNPDGTMHGFVARDGFEHAHAGDFGNIEVGEDGTGTLSFFMPGLTLTGEQHNVAGKAVILHEKEDDFGQPTGNAGGRIGCGKIELLENR
jgi:Cu-Zn family superoxide dismutase